MRDEELERIQRKLRTHPTEEGDPETGQEGDSGKQNREAAPINAEDKSLLHRYHEELSRYKNPTNHAMLLDTAILYCQYRNPRVPNNDPASAHGISLSNLLKSPEAAEKFEVWVLELHNQYGERIAPKTEDHLRNTVRQFGDLVGDDGRPQHIEEIRSTAPRKSNQEQYDPTPERSNIHHWGKTVVDILDSPCVHLRDKAIIAVSWEAGTRPSEAFAIEAGHLTDRGDHFVLEVVDSKTNDRTPHLMASMPYLRKWLIELDQMSKDVDLSTSPLSLPPNKKIWTHQDDPTELSWYTFSSIGRKTGNKLGLQRPTNLKQFRKSRASVLAAQEGITEYTLRTRFGWTHGSNAPAHYIAKFSDEANQQIADADGGSIEISEEWADPAPVQCASCDRWSPRHLDNCYWCGSEMEGKENHPDTSELERIRNKARVNEEAKAALRERIGDIDLSARSMELAIDVVEIMNENPDLAKESLAYVLLTEYEDFGIDRVIELLEGDDEGLRSIFEGS
jgi:integrase